MFNGCYSLVQPDQAARDDLQDTNGVSWENTEKCPVQLTFAMKVTSTSTLMFEVTGGGVVINDIGDGEYFVTSTDPITKIKFADDVSSIDVTEVVIENISTLVTFEDFFLPSVATTMSKLEKIVFDDIDTLNIQNTDNMFRGTTALAEVNLKDLKTSNVTSMFGMFQDTGLIPDIVSFDTSNVQNFSYMFAGCKWDTVDISGFSFRSAKDIAGMFERNTNAVDILMPHDFSTEYPNADMNRLYYGCTSLMCIDRINTVGATDKTDMFTGCDALIRPTTDEINLIISPTGSNWRNYEGCPLPKRFEIIVTSPVEPVILADGTITTVNNQDGTWTLSSLEIIGHFQFDDQEANTHVTKVELTLVDTLVDLISTFNPTDDINGNIMSSLKEVIIGQTGPVSSTSRMFRFCTALESIDFTGLDTSNLQETQAMFNTCPMMKEIDIRFMNTSVNLNMANMFKIVDEYTGEIKTTTILLPDDITSTKPAADMKNMFMGQSELLCINKIDTTNATDTTDMFSGCSKLKRPNTDEQEQILLGSSWENTDPCPIPLVPPSEITDFQASDDREMEVLVTFSPASGFPTPTYDLYKDNGLVAEGIEPGYIYNTAMPGTNTYYVIAKNSEGEKMSNSDEGTATNPNIQGPFFLIIKIPARPVIEPQDAITLVDVGGGYWYATENTSTYFEFPNIIDNEHIEEIGIFFIENMDYFKIDGLPNLTKVKTFEENPGDFVSSLSHTQDMIINCSNVTEIDLRHISVSNVQNMERTFYNNTAVKNIFMFSDFATVNPTASMIDMFNGCVSLECITQIGTENATDTTGMFERCDALVRPNPQEIQSILNGASWTNDMDCPLTPFPPSDITDFNASDDQYDGIHCTWTHSNGYPKVQHDLYRNAGLLAENVNSGFIDTNTSIGTTYTYQVLAKNDEGYIVSNEDTGVRLEEPRPPSVITDFNASDDREDGVLCTWGAADGHPEPTYDLYRNDVMYREDAASGFLDENVSPDTTYEYYVKAVNSEGFPDSNKDTGQLYTGEPPSHITDFNASDDQPDGVHCTWTNSTGTPTPTYDLYREATAIQTNISSGVIDTTAVEGQTYTYHVLAKNTNGQDQSNPDDGGVPIPDVPPSTITDFNASDGREDYVQCTWSNASGRPTPTYDIYRDGSRIGTSVTSPYNDTSGSSGITYTYYVMAINTEGSTQSNSNNGYWEEPLPVGPPDITSFQFSSGDYD
jgi:surface protein